MHQAQNVFALAIAAGLLAAASARAQVASEGFNYAPGTSVISTEGTGGTGWGLNWNSKTDTTGQSQVSAASLSYTDGSGNTLATSGGSLISSTANSTTAQPERALSGTFGALAAANTAAPGTLWMSYLWQGLNTTGSGSGIYRQSTMMFITGATSTAGSGSERLDIGMPNISVANQATVNPNLSLWVSGGLSGQTAIGATPLQSSVAANNGSTTFVLAEFVVDTSTATADTVNVWLNPTLSGTTPVGSPNLSYSLQDISTVNGIRIQSGNLSAAYGTVGGSQQVDEINFGNTISSVEPLIAPVPEPTVWSLAMLGGSLTFAFLKRRHPSAK